MPQIQQLDLAQTMENAENIRGARTQNRLMELMAPYQMRQAQRADVAGQAELGDAERKRYGLLANIAISQMGDDFDSLTDTAEQQRRYKSALANVRLLAPDVKMDTIPQEYSPDAVRMIRGIAQSYGGKDATKYQFGADLVSVDDQGNPYIVTTKKDPATGQVVSVQTPVQGGRLASKQGLTPQQQAELDAETAGKKKTAEIGAEVALAGDVAGAQAQVKSAETQAAEREKAKAASMANYIAIGEDAARGIAPIARAIDLLDQVGTGGMYGTAKLAIQQAFGVEGADEGELSANLGKAVLSQLRMTFGAAFTDAEGERLTRIEAGFGKNTGSNKRLLNNALEIMKEAAARGARAARAQGDDFTADEIERAVKFRISGGASSDAASDADRLLEKYR